MLDAETKLLLNAAIKSLAAIQETLREYVDAAREQSEAEHYQCRQPPPLPVDVRSELPLPVTVREYYETEQTQRPPQWWRRTKAVLEVFGVAAAITVAIFTVRTFMQIARQTSQIEANNRPWLRIMNIGLDPFEGTHVLSFGPIGTVPPSDGAVALRVEFIIKNVGNAVAQNVVITPGIVFEPQNTSVDVIENGERRSCEYWLHESMPKAFTWSAVFPGDVVRFRDVVAMPFDKAAINHVPGRSGDLLSGVLIGCVTYQYPRPDQTRAAFHIMGPIDRFIEVGKPLDPPQVHLLRDEHYEYAQ